MENSRINLTIEDIANKEFKVDVRGVRLQEVDAFLDLVIKDYAEYNHIIKELGHEYELLLDENNRLKDELRKLRSNIEAASALGNNQASNIDLLKRISQLEKVVYGKDL